MRIEGEKTESLTIENSLWNFVINWRYESVAGDIGIKKVCYDCCLNTSDIEAST